MRPTAANGWSIVAAPASFGLRPPARGVVPGAAEAPSVLRSLGLATRLAEYDVTDAGDVAPAAPYADDADAARQRVRNHDAILEHADRLADAIGDVWAAGRRPLVIGGDC